MSGVNACLSVLYIMALGVAALSTTDICHDPYFDGDHTFHADCAMLGYEPNGVNIYQTTGSITGLPTVATKLDLNLCMGRGESDVTGAGADPHIFAQLNGGAFGSIRCDASAATYSTPWIFGKDNCHDASGSNAAVNPFEAALDISTFVTVANDGYMWCFGHRGAPA